MQKYFMYVLVLLLGSFLEASDFHVAVQAKKTKSVPIGLVTVGKKQKLQGIIDRLHKDLLYSGQCHVVRKSIQSLNSLSAIKNLFSDEVSLALFISDEGVEVVWRLYDLLSVEMIAADRCQKREYKDSVIAHQLADQIWPVLMGTASSFSSKIAYCKQIWKKYHNHEKPYKQIWIADFDGSNAQLFIDIPTVSFAPRWSSNPTCPLLFYSENTLSNVQLVMSNMFNKRQVMCCFDGLNMQPTFNKNGKEVVFCLSKDGSSQLYHSYVDNKSGKRRCDRLTDNSGNNFGPCYLDDHHVAFVSDFATRRPQIYIMDLRNKNMQRITDGAYCACPAYCPVSNKLVYSKMVDGAMQLCEYDCQLKKHKQLTQGPGSKEEPSWSSCGNYILFGVNEGLKSRIAQLNLLTGKVKYVTTAQDHCTYPSCSPVYSEFFGILN